MLLLAAKIYGSDQPNSSRFASEVPSEIFIAATIQNFLLNYKNAPEMAVFNVADWVKKNHIDIV